MNNNQTTLLDNKIAIVAGGLGRIGKNFVNCIIENGGTAIVADISSEHYISVKKQNWLKNEKVDFCPLNITSKDSILSLIEFVSNKYGKIDAFINTTFPQTKSLGGLFEDITYESFCESLNIHLGGYFLCAQQMALFYKKQGYGNIINIASIQGVGMPKFDTYKGVFINGVPMTSEIDYTCNKFSIVAMSKYIAKYFKDFNIRCNSISPGGILDGQPEAFLEKYRRHCLSKGMLNGEDLKGALLFLLSDGSQYLNGQNIVVDDGYTL